MPKSPLLPELSPLSNQDHPLIRRFSLATFQTGNPIVDAKPEIDEAFGGIAKQMSDKLLIRCFVLDNYPNLVKTEIRDTDNMHFFPDGLKGSNVKVKKTGVNRYHVTVGKRWGLFSIDDGSVVERCGTLISTSSK